MSVIRSVPSSRSLAVAIWACAVGWLTVAPPALSAESLFLLVLMVSIASSLAHIIADHRTPSDADLKPITRWIALAVSLAIPLLWAVVLSGKSSANIQAFLCATAILPIALTGMAMTWIANIPFRASQTPTADDSIGSPENSPALALSDVATDMSEECSAAAEGESESILEFSPIDFDSPASAGITQWQTRRRHESGETSEGGMQVEFAEGQREVTVHLSFCPPFAQRPNLLTEDLDGADLEIRVSASFPFGARLAVRRPLRSNDRTTRSPAETCRIGFVATSESARRAA